VANEQAANGDQLLWLRHRLSVGRSLSARSAFCQCGPMSPNVQLVEVGAELAATVSR